jgi:hypothetical protein
VRLAVLSSLPWESSPADLAYPIASESEAALYASRKKMAATRSPTGLFPSRT